MKCLLVGHGIVLKQMTTEFEVLVISCTNIYIRFESMLGKVLTGIFAHDRWSLLIRVCTTICPFLPSGYLCIRSGQADSNYETEQVHTLSFV